MKIVRSVRELFGESEKLYQRLSEDVRAFLKPEVEKNGWFFTHRLKSEESFALKIETGRVSTPERLEDFFACTIVVPTLDQIERAEQLVQNLYAVDQRRPKVDSETHKHASSFVFDDLRLYVNQRPSNSVKDSDLDGLLFEIQIKTILQHAWGVATHDLIYKSESVSWARERIAFQVKAMLEHAEIAISEANKLADATAVAKRDELTADILKLIQYLNEIWSPHQLPKDMKRLAENILTALKVCDLRANAFKDLIEREKRRIGLLPANLSPYAFTVQALANDTGLDLQKQLGRRHVRAQLVIHSDMELPLWMSAGHPKIVKLA